MCQYIKSSRGGNIIVCQFFFFLPDETSRHLHRRLATKCLDRTKIPKDAVPATVHLPQQQLEVLLESDLLYKS